MPQTADRIKLIEGALKLGFSPSEAIQKALGRSLSAFGAGHGWTPSEVSMCVTFYGGRMYNDIRDALCTELNIPREYLDRLIEQQRSTEVA